MYKECEIYSYCFEQVCQSIETGLLIFYYKENVSLADTPIEYINDTASELLACKKDMAPGDTLGQALRNSSDLLEAVEKALPLNQSVTLGDFALAWPPDTTCWLQVRVLPLEDGGACLTIKDATKHKQILEELQESENRYRRITEAVTDYIYTVRMEEGCPVETHHSSTCEAVTGYTAEEFDSNPHLWIQIVPEEDQVIVLEHAKLVHHTTPPAPIEHRIVRKDGTIRWVQNTCVPYYNCDGELLAYDGLVHDITERRQIEEILRQSEKMKAIGELAGGMAHDFNNRLVAIQGFAQLLFDEIQDPVLHEYAERIYTAAQRAGKLTRQMLTFARKEEHQNVPLNIHSILGEVALFMEHSIDKRIALVENFRATSFTTRGDPTQIENAFLNLAINARDAMPEGGRMLFETRNVTLDESFTRDTTFDITPGPCILVSLSDTGTGMSEETRRRIFEPFFTTKARDQGTGMGLASVYGTIAAHQGAIEVESTEGEGTTFRIYFPLMETTGEAAVEKNGKGSSESRPLNIMLVDDEEDVRELVCVALTGLNHKAIAFPNGREAIAHYREHWQEIDLTILDMMMPGLTGEETYKALCEINPKAVVVLATGNTRSNETDRLLQQGLRCVIQKPFEVEELSRILTKHTRQ